MKIFRLQTQQCQLIEKFYMLTICKFSLILWINKNFWLLQIIFEKLFVVYILNFDEHN